MPLKVKRCETCGKKFSRYTKLAKKLFKAQRFCSRTCVRRVLKPDKDLVSPYRQTSKNGQKIDVHRDTMEKTIGRKLDRFEFVHHIDHNKLNNSISNLELMTPRQHAVHHKQKHPVSKNCSECAIEFTPHPTKRARAKTCSKQCAIKRLSRLNRKPDSPCSIYRNNAYPSQIKNRKSI